MLQCCIAAKPLNGKRCKCLYTCEFSTFRLRRNLKNPACWGQPQTLRNLGPTWPEAPLDWLHNIHHCFHSGFFFNPPVFLSTRCSINWRGQWQKLHKNGTLISKTPTLFKLTWEFIFTSWV